MVKMPFEPVREESGRVKKSVITELLKYQDLFKKSERIYREEEDAVNSWGASKDKDTEYFQTMVKKGTMNDKLNALSMLIKKNPTKSLNYLQQLIQMGENKNRKMAETAFYQLKDVFMYLLKDGEKLKAFQHNPLICEREQTDIPNYDLTAAYF